jgi:hypothetical protein
VTELVNIANGTPLEDPSSSSIGVAAGDFDGDGSEEVNDYLLLPNRWYSLVFSWIENSAILLLVWSIATVTRADQKYAHPFWAERDRFSNSPKRPLSWQQHDVGED